MSEPIEFTVRADLWDGQTKIADVMRKRHTAVFPDSDGEKSRVTFCNNCGDPFCGAGSNRCLGCGWGQEGALDRTPKEQTGDERVG